MKVDGSLKSLIQGVSQQPARSRLPGQCTAQDNMTSNPVDGLSRRPPLDWIGELFTSSENVQFHEFNQGSKKFILAALPNEIRVFDLEGNEKNVTEQDSGFDYLTGASLTFSTLDNLTFVANKETVCEMKANTFASFLDYGSIIYIRGANYARKYEVTITYNAGSPAGALTTLTASHTTPDGSATAHGAQIATDYIATQLVNALQTVDDPTNVGTSASSVAIGTGAKSFTASTGKAWTTSQVLRIYQADNLSNYMEGTVTTYNSGSGALDMNITKVVGSGTPSSWTIVPITGGDGIFNINRVGDIIHVTWNGVRTDRFTIAVSDGVGGVNMVAVNNSVRQTAELPKYAPHNYHVAVTGDGNAGADDWYLVFTVKPDATGVVANTGEGFGRDGTWVETVKNKTEYLVDKTTMPHVLEYDSANDEFFFYPGDWAGRQVGDTDSNPNPSFIGRTIEDMSYFQQRLVMLSGPAVIMSRTNRPLDFWIETATMQTDSDAIDIESTAKGVTKMLRVIPQNRDLVIFADGAAQFIVFGRNAVTPKNSALVLTTSFESNLDAKPVPAGRNLFFAINYGDYTGIREFYTEGTVDINDSRPITQHVLKYLEGQVDHMASTSNFDTLLVKTTQDRILYLYEYIWVDDQKVQSSWSRWLLPNDIKHFFFVESIIYVIAKIENTYILQKLDLNTLEDEGLTYQVKLDNKMFIENVDTDFVYPHDFMPPIEDMLFVQGAGCPNPGQRAVLADYDEGTKTITFTRDMEGGTIICGQTYRSSYKPTVPIVKDQDGVKVGTGNLTISKFLINCRRSGAMKAIISGRYKEAVELLFTGRFVADSETAVGEEAIVDKSYIVPFREDIDNGELELVADKHTPLTIMDIEWIGQYRKRGQRITQGG